MSKIIAFLPRRQSAPRTCEGCGISIAEHPPSHRLCRPCFGYARLREVLPRITADIESRGTVAAAGASRHLSYMLRDDVMGMTLRPRQ
jgi:hypothetical protein